MTATSIDHMVSLIIFISAIMLFIGMFSQTIQTGVEYQLHRVVSSKASDLLDNILLSPGIPTDWGQKSAAPEGFGLQAVEFTQYQLSPFSLMRLSSSTGTPVSYSVKGQTYSNITMGFGQSLLVPLNQVIDYSTASELLGVNGSYGFSLTLTPIVNVDISETQDSSQLSLSAEGPGFPLANAEVDYALITVTGHIGSSPTYNIAYGTTTTDNAGLAVINLGFDGSSTAYALIATAHLSGLVGIGYHEHVLYDDAYIIPLVNGFADGEDPCSVILAHSRDVLGIGDPDVALNYKATFVVLTEDFKLRESQFANETGSADGYVNPPLRSYDTLTLDTSNPGILVIAYNDANNATAKGVVVMPWGLSSLAFPMTFGGP